LLHRLSEKDSFRGISPSVDGYYNDFDDDDDDDDDNDDNGIKEDVNYNGDSSRFDVEINDEDSDCNIDYDDNDDHDDYFYNNDIE